MQSLFFYIWRVNWRWYFTGLVVALAFLGISLGQSPTDRNQEIVIRFHAETISDQEAEAVVSEVTDQLRHLGIADIQISELLDGELKITYYSALEVSVIKNSLYQQSRFPLGDTAFNEREGSSKVPFQDHPQTYRLDVIKIQNDLGSALGFQGLLVEVKSSNDQYLKPKLALDSPETGITADIGIEKRESCIYRNVVLPFDHTSHRIPEVRAGPLS